MKSKISGVSAKRKPSASKPPPPPAKVLSVSWPGNPGALTGGTDADNEEITRQAPWWNYALLQRERWSGTEVLSVAQQSRATRLWNRLFAEEGGPRPELPSEDAPMAEIAIQFSEEGLHWQYRTMPWEFVMSSFIRAHRPHELRERYRLPVIRRLRRQGKENPPPTLPKDISQWKVLVVLSAPGFISRAYQLKSELNSIESLLRGATIEHVWTPSFKQVKERISEFKPDIVHFAGCDTHQARALSERTDLTARESEVMMAQLLESAPAPGWSDADEPDGYALRAEDSTMMHGDSARIECVNYLRLPDLFSRHQPALVCWNTYHSGNRVAAMTVGMGRAGASVGFQDFIDDELAEEYFDEFYRGLVDNRGLIGRAHARGMKALWRQPDGVRGAGIMLWTGTSRLNEFKGLTSNHPSLQPVRTELHQGPIDKESVNIYIKVPSGLNYAQLHQRQYPFERFRIFLNKPLKLDNVNVEVRLNGEDRELVYRKQFDLDAPFVDLSNEIEFPLTSPLARSCGESVVTTLYVKISFKDQVLLSNTYATRLLPADQWRFSERSAFTLASFVFPRDTSVEKLVLQSQKYVRVLRDDAMAGFEGYQAGNDEAVDLQVRALWYALLHEYRLGYINPPPAYSKDADSQRLRTPTMVLNGGWGTCIDLALLLAAAFELIDVYAVVVVLKTHAFVGYWRNPEGHSRFLEMSDGVDLDEKWTFLPRRPLNGMFLSTSVKEIQHYVETGDLVLLEATLLTTMGSFDDAAVQGLGNLSDPQEFDYMIDLMSARTAQVTPLPLNLA
jgi:hypothetical protein